MNETGMNLADSILDRLEFSSGANSDEKLAELMLYVADKCLPDECYGATKLNKILYYADFLSYLERGSSITGAEYMGLPKGPVPRRLVAVRQRLLESRDVAMREEPYRGKVQKRLIPLRTANLSGFSSWDIALVDHIIGLFWGKTATVVSILSHDRIWRIAGTEKAGIPYQAAYISDDPADMHDSSRLGMIAARHGVPLQSS